MSSTASRSALSSFGPGEKKPDLAVDRRSCDGTSPSVLVAVSEDADPVRDDMADVVLGMALVLALLVLLDVGLKSDRVDSWLTIGSCDTLVTYFPLLPCSPCHARASIC